MSLAIGIVGLPNVGKSTIFNALTRSHAANASNYPFCTIDPNVGIVEVPDQRLDALAKIVHPERILPTAIEFVDIAGLVAGASQGEGLGNQFLAHIRNCDAVAQIVRLFEDKNITHVAGDLHPKRDLDIIQTELILADLQTVGKRLQRIEKAATTGDKELQRELAVVKKVKEALDKGVLVNHLDLAEEEQLAIRDLCLLTNKPFIYIANVSETSLADFNYDEVRKHLELRDSDVLVPISAKLEADLVDVTPEEREEYLQELKLTSSGLDDFIKAAYKALGLITYLTAGVKEVRAWTIKKGFTAPQAAGVIHTDFEKGFICAETIHFEDYIKYNGESGAKEKGAMKTQGKTYVVEDGDVMNFRFNV